MYVYAVLSRVCAGLMIGNTDTRHYLSLSKQIYRCCFVLAELTVKQLVVQVHMHFHKRTVTVFWHESLFGCVQVFADVHARAG